MDQIESIMVEKHKAAFFGLKSGLGQKNFFGVVGPYRLSTHCRHVVLLYFVQSQVWTRYFGTTLTLSRPVDENSNLAGLCDAMTSLENKFSLSVSRVDQA